MDNCPHQVVLAGEPTAVEAVVGRVKERGLICEDLPFNRAYHTPGFLPALGPIAEFFDSLRMGRATVPLYSCAIEGRMADDPAEVRRLAVEQWTRAVRVPPNGRGDAPPMGSACSSTSVPGATSPASSRTPCEGAPRSPSRRTCRGARAWRSSTTWSPRCSPRAWTSRPDHLYARRRPIRLELQSPPRKARQAPGLAVGFPSMTLSDDLIERFRTRPSDSSRDEHPPAEANGHHRRLERDQRPRVDLAGRASKSAGKRSRTYRNLVLSMLTRRCSNSRRRWRPSSGPNRR